MLSSRPTSTPTSDVDISVNKAWCNTRTKLNTIDYTWTINNFSLRHEKMGEPLKSPIFTDGINECVTWRLGLYPKGQNEESKEFVYIFLYLVSYNKSKLEAKYEFSISNKHTTLESTKFQSSFSPEGKGFGISEFIRQDALSNILLPDDILIISCKISFLSDSTNISGPSDVVKIIVPEPKLNQNLGNLFDNGEFCDLTIAVGIREMRAHKAILTARSSYFAAMFKHETQENRLNRIEVTDVEFDVLKEMVNFIYTDKAPNLDKVAAKLLPAADKYALERLKAMCEASLRSTMSIEDAIETLTLADRHSAVQLKSYAKAFIKSHISEIIESSGWENLITTQIQQMIPSIEPTKLDKEDKD